jgi:hypothetical protein
MKYGKMIMNDDSKVMKYVVAQFGHTLEHFFGGTEENHRTKHLE